MQICHFTATVEQPFFLKNGSSLSCLHCRANLLFLITKGFYRARSITNFPVATPTLQANRFPEPPKNEERTEAAFRSSTTAQRYFSFHGISSRRIPSVVSIGFHCMGPLYGLQLGTHQCLLPLYTRNPVLQCAVSEFMLFSE